MMQIESNRAVQHSEMSIGWIALILALSIWYIAFPGESVRVIACLALLTMLLLVVIPHHRVIVLQFTAAGIIVAGCTVELARQFPERTMLMILMALVTVFFTFRFLRSGEYAVAWLIATLGMSTAPFTELFLERNLWTLGSCMIGMIQTIRSRRLQIQSSSRLRWASIAWIALILLTMISCTWSVYPHVTLRFAGILVFDFMILLQVLAASSQENRRSDLVTTILAFAGIYCLAAAIAFAARISAFGWLNATGFRIYVFERHPNYAIFFLLNTLPLWLLPLSRAKRMMRWVSAAGLLVSTLYLIFLSYSRQGYIVLLAFAMVLLFVSRTHVMRRLLLQIFIPGILVLTSMFIISSSLRDRFLTISSTTTNLRVNAWKVFQDLIIDRPLIGYGMGTNRYIYPKGLSYLKPVEPATRQFLFEAHNAYIDLLVGLGIIGLGVFLVFLCVCTLARIKGMDPEIRIARILSLGLWIDLFFNFRLHAQDTSVFLMVLLGFVAAVNAKHDRVSEPGRSPAHPILQYFLLAVAILFCSTPWLGKKYVSTAQDLLEVQNWSMVQKNFHRASIVEPLNAHPRYYLGLCYEAMLQPETALQEYRTAVNLCPNYPFYRFYLAKAHAENRQFEDAMKELEIARNLEPYDPDGRVRFNLGILEWRMGYRELARQDFFTSMLLNPSYSDDPYWENNQEMKRRLTEDFVNLAGNYQSYTNITYDNLRFLPAVLDILIKTDYQDFAMRCIISCAFNYADYIDVVIKSVELLIQREQYEMAQEIIYFALSFHPQDAHMLNYLALLYLNAGDYPMARYCAEQSLDNWLEIAVDNFMAYQILNETAVRTGDRALLSRVKRAIDYLSDGRYVRQTNDLSIHIGSNSYLVKPVQISNQ